ncbi:MAG: anaerobic ribonucleoside-triphosphate reductase activating protein [Bacilli bacterium]|nr:anaerobic ribonucleoside-triphosphate reductase activating protein [Bacilli bacterium]MBQ8218654.1 anaerobic ribonucleoside-triphosphate reductase activating protein [Bacilli bacterium]
MNYMKIYKTSLADGEGWRTVLFVSGCHHHCKDCHNKEAWNPNAGYPFTQEVKEMLFDCITDQIDGLTLSGGDPLHKKNIAEVTALCKEFKDRFPNKTIWLYTGNLYRDSKDLEVMKYVDVVVDGEFRIDLKDTTLAFRGSSNQRIIDVHTNEILVK